MGRRRENTFIRKPDRIAAADLKQWMRINDISINQLSLALSSMPGFGACQYRTVDGWLREYRDCPAWLQHRINFVANHGGALPRYGERWPAEPQPAPLPAPLAMPAPEPLPPEWSDLPEAPDGLLATPATCECGAALLPDGKCSFRFCLFSDDDAPDDE